MQRVCLAFALLLQPAWLWAANLTEVRLWDEPQQTRVVLDLSSSAEHEIFTLENPHRVVIDLRGAQRAAMRPVEAGGVVRRVRFGDRGNELRVVLDLTEASKPSSYLLPPAGEYGHRLVVELPHADGAARDPVVSVADKTVVVVIDPGHGGEDPGAIGPGQVYEKDVALAIARRLKRLIDAEPHMRAVLTREGDYFLPLRRRTEIAQKSDADLFVSLHADAFRDSRVHGSSVYVLSHTGASSEHARVLANRENAADLIGGVEIQDKDELLASVLLDISQSAAIEASIDVAGRLLGELGNLGKLHKPTVQRAGFAVLKAPDVPSILVETAFISNAQEARRLQNPQHQEKLAQRLHRGILSYFETYRPQRVVAQAAD